MLATLTGVGLRGTFGARDLFENLDLVVAPQDMIGLVGANGSGKTTLLRILAGEISPAAGRVVLSPPDASVGYLAQTRVGSRDQTVADFVKRRTGVSDAQDALERTTKALVESRSGAEEAYSEALERWLALGAADLEERLEALADQLELRVDLAHPLESLSGGQEARVGLMSILLSRFDLLLLDEPTNNLDVDGLNLLEDFLTGLRVGVMVVSHDREFLSRTVTSVLELDHQQRKNRFVRSDYRTYLVERQRAREAERSAYEEYADRRDDLMDRARTQRTWLDRGMAAARRTVGDSDKITRKGRIEGAGQQAAKARQIQRAIDRLEEVPEPRKEWQLQFRLPAVDRSGKLVVQLAGATVVRGGFTLGPVSLELNWSDRVAIIGPNGAGKSTLIQLMLGKLLPTEGTAFVGPSVIVGEVDQARSLFAGPAALVDAFGRVATGLNEGERRTLLAKFGLGELEVQRPGSSLSPGERTRAALALLQSTGANLLVLDEPTNHLDLPAIEQLESAIRLFPGTLLLVSHDRQLLENVSISRWLSVSAGMVEEVSG